MTTIEELAASQQSMANQLDALSGALAALAQRQEEAHLTALLSDATPLRMGAYPAGAAVTPAGTTTGPSSTALVADGAITDDAVASGAITETKIADNAITTPKLAANIVIGFLLTTALSGRRVEIEEGGITLFDSTDEILVRIPTTADPVFLSGDMEASTLVAENVDMRGSGSKVAPGALLTVSDSLKAPTSAPVLERSYEELAVTGSTWASLDSYGCAYVSGELWRIVVTATSRAMTLEKVNLTTGAVTSVALGKIARYGEIPKNATVRGVAANSTHAFALMSVASVEGPVIWKFDASTGAYVSSVSPAMPEDTQGARSTIFYDSTAGEVILATAASIATLFRGYNPSTLAVGSVNVTSTGRAISPATEVMTGGASDGTLYWLFSGVGASSLVRAYNRTTGAYQSNRDWGYGASTGAQGYVNRGFLWDGTNFRFIVPGSTAIGKATNWDWTTESAIYYVGYSWYDSAGTTHETPIGPLASLTMYRRMRLLVQNPSIPTGGADDPNNARIYMERGASPPASGGSKLQVTDALSIRHLTTFATGGAADPGASSFPSSPGQIASEISGWSLKGNGTALFTALQALAGANKILQSGSANLAMGGAATATQAVTFGTAFANTPVVLVNRSTSTGTSPKVHLWASGVSTTGFTLNGATGDGTTSANTIAGSWVAIDPAFFT